MNPPPHSGPDDPSYGQPPFGPPPPSGGDDRSDPLVPPPAGGFAVWLEWLQATLRRSWRPLAWIFLLTFALPQIVVTRALDSMSGGTVSGLAGSAEDSGDPTEFDPFGELAAAVDGQLLLGFLGGAVALAGLGALGWAAAIWAVTQGATGLPVTVPEALRAGARRLLPMLGWYLVYGLLIGVGLVLCVLPGLYLAAAASLFGFVVIYERGRNPIARSFQLVHQGMGAGLGRAALLFGFMIVASCVLGGLTGLLGLGAGDGAGRLVGSVVEAVLTIPLSMVVLVGLLLTYTQARARLEPVSTVALWNAANPPSPDSYGHPGPSGGSFGA